MPTSPDRRYDCGFLSAILPVDRVTMESSRLEQYSQDASNQHEPAMPDAVVWPHTAEEVAAVLSAANERGVPVTPWSGGSGLEGNAIPVAGGIVCNTYEMTDVSVHPDDLQAVVGAGVVYDDLNAELASHGLRFPPGISSGEVATIGGMVATNASGFNAVGYGETRDSVHRLEVVLPDGRIIECGRNVVKTSSGYSLKDLFVGSEGTLGVVTEATLGLVGLPAEKRAAVVTFPSPHDACRAVSEIIRFGLRPGALEFVDAFSIEAINAYSDGADLPVAPTLIIELHANNSGIDEDVAFARGICEDNGAATWEAADESEMADVWRARRDANPALHNWRAGWDMAMPGDVVVPISRYPELIDFVNETADELDLVCSNMGHAGDGNLHYTPIVEVADAEMQARAEELNRRVVDFTIDLGGTITGEHGVGLGKRKFMAAEHGTALSVMRQIKDTLDPNGIMNPGKVLPERNENGNGDGDVDGD